MDYIMYVWFGIIGLIILPLICSMARSCGILPIQLFSTYWKKQYENYKEYYENKSEELDKFRADIYERQVIQDKVAEIRNLQNVNNVLNAKIEVLERTNNTLTEALKSRVN
jgi:hypothetical protein